MEKQIQFYGSIKNYNKIDKTVDTVILHYGEVNENRWVPMPGCFDSFFASLKKNKKKIAVGYMHDPHSLIGSIDVDSLVLNGNELSGLVVLSNTPFVNDTVIPQLEDGTLQGSSPCGYPKKDSWNHEKQQLEVLEGVLSEISLVGLPADLKSSITNIKASIETENYIKELEEKYNNDFEIDLLTI